MGIKISALPPVASALLTDLVPAVQAGTTSKETLQQILTLFNANITGFLPLAGGTMTGSINFGGFQALNAADPTTAQMLATKNYVDTVAAGLNPAESVYAASTGALTVTYSNGVSGVGATLTNATTQATFSLDGVSPAVGQRVLIKNQAAPAQNGIYTVTSVGSGATNWVLTRALDYDTPANINSNGLIPVIAGTANAGTGWLLTSTVTTVGTDPLTYVQFGSTASGTVNSGLINQLAWYASGGTAVSGLATANNGLLVTSAGGVPSISTTTPAALTIPQPNIVGVTNASNAAAGSIGELITAFLPSSTPISFPSTTSTVVTQISLTAGDWDVFGQVGVGGTGVGTIICWTGLSSTVPSDTGLVSEISAGGVSFQACLPTPFLRVNIASTQTVYLGVYATGSSLLASGGIYARRVR